MSKMNFYVLSGAMGAGKSAVLSRLTELGILCVPEPARQILAEQRSIKGMGVPEKSPDLFTMLMLSRSLHNYSAHCSETETVFFDRGIPDMIAYARLFRLDETPYANAAQEFRYNPNVFYFPAWESIYTTDSERKMSFEDASAFGSVVKSIYAECGYHPLDVPRLTVEERVQFILNCIKTHKGTSPK
jgi:predicted ATPase